MVIKPKEGKYFVKRRAEDQVFAEVSMADDVNYQQQIEKSGRTDINDRVPLGGSYVYADGQANQDWLVGGDMRIDRVLSRQEAQEIAREQGVKDLPYKAEVEEILGRSLSNELPSDIKFSVKTTDPDVLRDDQLNNMLFTGHNITEQALIEADKRGGLPMPSLYIAKVSDPVRSFGEITLVGTPKLAIPARGEPVYKSDAYTARMPFVDKEVSAAAAKYAYRLQTDVRDNIMDRYSRNRFYDNEYQILFANMAKTQDEKTIMILDNGIARDSDNLLTLTPHLRGKYLLDTNKLDKIIEDNSEYGVGFLLENLLGFSNEFNVDRFFTADINDWLTTERFNAERAINKQDASKYKPLVRRTLSRGIRYTPLEATLDNIVAVMRKQRGPAKEAGFDSDESMGVFRARATPRFKTFDEVKKAKR